MPDDLTPTPEDYAIDPREVLELAAAATAGPWEWLDEHVTTLADGERIHRYVIAKEDDDESTIMATPSFSSNGKDGSQCCDDADFVTAARTALPALARRLIAEQKEVARLKDLLVRLYDSIDDTLDNGQAANDAAEALGREC